MDEVVVVGYDAQKKANLTGAVANVNVEEAIASRPVTDVAKAFGYGYQDPVAAMG